MAKRGRPVLDDPRVNEYRVRMNSIEFERLDRVCKDLGMNKADTMRKLIEDYENEHMKQEKKLAICLIIRVRNFFCYRRVIDILFCF